MDRPLFLSPKPNYSSVVLHLLHCINCTSLKQTNVSWAQAHIDLIYFVKRLEEHRAEGTKHTVGVPEAVCSYFQMLSVSTGASCKCEWKERMALRCKGRSRWPQDKPVKISTPQLASVLRSLCPCGGPLGPYTGESFVLTTGEPERS